MQIDKHIKKRWVLRKHQRYKIGLFIILYNKCALTYTYIHTNIIILYIKVDCKINQFFATKQIYFSSDFVLCALLSRLFFFYHFTVLKSIYALLVVCAPSKIGLQLHSCWRYDRALHGLVTFSQSK